jgi:hypothetical protein
MLTPETHLYNIQGFARDLHSLYRAYEYITYKCIHHLKQRAHHCVTIHASVVMEFHMLYTF